MGVLHYRASLQGPGRSRESPPLFIAGAVTTGDAETGEVDLLPANRVWLYAIILTVGYLVSRGLAKSGSEEPYTEDEGGGGPGVGDRVRAAAEAARQP